MPTKWLSLLPVLVAVGACFPPDDGINPPLERIYFPVGIAASTEGDRLYVANSDFDLQFNAGTLQVFDASEMARVAHEIAATHAASDDRSVIECPDGTEAQSEAESFNSPGPCKYSEPESLVLDVARVSPFVADLVHTVYGGQQRLLAPVRGDATVHWADVNPGGDELDCGQDNPLRECNDDHRRGDSDDETTPEGDNLPTEPFALAVSDDGKAIAVGHQTQGSVSLLENTESGPELRYILEDLPLFPMSIAAVPVPAIVEAQQLDYQPGFLVVFRHFGVIQPTIELLRYFDAEASGHTPFLQRAASVPITVASGFDSRSIALDDSSRQTCEAGCDDDVDCLTECSYVAVDAYVASRSPASLMIGKTRPSHSATGSDDLPNLSDMEPLRGGPSKVFVGDVQVDDEGNTEKRVFVIAFDSRLMYIYNPEVGEIESRLLTGRGPQGVAIDSNNGLGYIAHFTDSYISVVDLNQSNPTYGQILLNVGEPTPPRASE